MPVMETVPRGIATGPEEWSLTGYIVCPCCNRPVEDV